MINGLFKEISEEEIMSVNGGCGGGSPSPKNGKATLPPCHKCETAKAIIAGTNAQMFDTQDVTPTNQGKNLAAAVVNLAAHAVINNCEKNGHK